MFVALPFTPLLAQEWSQIAADIEGEAAFDNSGKSLDMNHDGSSVIIGATGNDSEFSGAGHARVYELIDGDWLQKGEDLDGEAQYDGSGFAVSMNGAGNIIAIGAPSNADGGSGAGHVRIYEWENEAWVQRGEDIDGTANYSESGNAIELSADGNTIVIGASKQDETASNSGQVRVFEWNENDWTPKGNSINGDEANNNFAYDVAISNDGNIIAVGAPLNSGGFVNGGQVKIFEWSGSEWLQMGGDLYGEDNFDRFGYSVSLNSDGTHLAVGAIMNSGGGTDAGHVRVFEWNGSAWEQMGADIDGEAADDNAGSSLSMSADGETVAIGAKGNDGAFGFNAVAGHVRVFQWNGSEWNPVGDDIEGVSDADYFGESVALSADGNIVAAGAHWNSGNGTSAGHVRVFESPIIDNIPTEDAPTFSLYPIPARDKVIIESTLINGFVEVQLLSGMGQIISRQQFNQLTKAQIELEGSPGMYFILIKTPDNLSRTFSVIKR
jgi:hypothetical protein